MGILWQDLRYGIRMMRKNPGFTAVVVLTLALGIGANTAVFSVVNTVLFRPLPYPNSARLVAIQSMTLGRKEAFGTAPGVYLDWRERSTSFEKLAGVRSTVMILSHVQQARKVSILACSYDFFNVIGVQPVFGRTFTPEEDQVGRADVALIDIGFWQRELGGALDILGRAIRLDDKTYTIVGISPPNIRFGSLGRAEVWIPIAADRRHRAGGDVLAVGRLRPGISLEAVQAELDVVMQGIAREHQQDSMTGVMVRPLSEWIAGDARKPFLALLAAVVFILLICCANVANLMMARATTRQREMAIRAALGAGRFRLVRQTFVESLALSTLGGTLGLLLAIALVRAVPAFEAFYVPRVDELAIDGSLLVIALLSTLTCSLLFGVVPALHAGQQAPQAVLQGGGMSLFSRPGGMAIRNALVSVQLALALVLLAGAGLMTNSFFRLLNIDLGFQQPNVLIVDVTLPYKKYNHAQSLSFFEQLMSDVRRMPGVEKVSAADWPPLTAILFPVEVEPQGQGAAQKCEAMARRIAPDYFQILGIPILAGRDLNPRDDRRTPIPVLINKSMGRFLFGDQNPIGRQLTTSYAEMKLLEIAGVVGDVRQLGLKREPGLQLYLPTWSPHGDPHVVLAHTAPNAGDMTAAIRRAVYALDPEVPAPEVTSMDAQISQQVAQPRFYMGVLGVFAVTGVVLAALGIYGVMAYSIVRQTHEFGIRMALGAGRRDIQLLVLGQAIRLISVGVIFGIAGALAATRLLSSLLYEVKPNDPVTYVGVVMLLGGLSLLTAFISARRAAAQDPMIALRHE